MFFYLLYGRYPYRGKVDKLGNSDSELYKNIAKAHMLPPDKFPNHLKEIFSKFFKIDENKRYSAEEFLNLDYFRFM